ncbi:MAG: hypothetical protein PUJ82_02230 [Spirochaetales bacterium]|nr:hypothetical protein [Spirochaetales bacterium]MDY5914050.1 hypothetical protein [Treponema sp.]
MKQALELLEENSIKKLEVSSLSKLYKTYALVGGMPEVVAKFINAKDITKVSAIYRNIFTSHIDDIAKYDTKLYTPFIHILTKQEFILHCYFIPENFKLKRCECRVECISKNFSIPVFLIIFKL